VDIQQEREWVLINARPLESFRKSYSENAMAMTLTVIAKVRAHQGTLFPSFSATKTIVMQFFASLLDSYNTKIDF
jgi:hypothetical protein